MKRPAPATILRKSEELNHVKTGQIAFHYRIGKGRQRGISISGCEIARALGCNQAMISRLEAGKRSWTPEFFRRYLDAVDSIVK